MFLSVRIYLQTCHIGGAIIECVKVTVQRSACNRGWGCLEEWNEQNGEGRSNMRLKLGLCWEDKIN
jgi:hypothetical protein